MTATVEDEPVSGSHLTEGQWEIVYVFNNTSQSWMDEKILDRIQKVCWLLNDAYGRPGLLDFSQWDWSGIRDSSEESKFQMFEVIRRILKESDMWEETLRRFKYGAFENMSDHLLDCFFFGSYKIHDHGTVRVIRYDSEGSFEEPPMDMGSVDEQVFKLMQQSTKFRSADDNPTVRDTSTLV